MGSRQKVILIDIERINILNPRVRNKRVFGAMTDNISKVGLKRPVTVTRCHSGIPGKDYDLVCGQGRIEAFIACGQAQIPALVIEASEEEALVMSLVENIARRQHRAIDLMQVMALLQRQGYGADEIALKTGLTSDYVATILHLLEHGEERLVAAVEAGQIPITTAVRIAGTAGPEMQKMLRELYETGELSGRKFLTAKKVIETRRLSGKARRDTGRRGAYDPQRPVVSADDILRVYRKEADRKRMLTRKAETVNGHLLFVTEALKTLFREDHFTTLLKAEGLMTLPKQLAALVTDKE